MTDRGSTAEAFNAFEAAGWETTAGGYGDFFGQITRRPIERLLDAAQADRGVRMLDVASDSGYAATERGASVIGVNPRFSGTRDDRSMRRRRSRVRPVSIG